MLPPPPPPPEFHVAPIVINVPTDGEGYSQVFNVSMDSFLFPY